MKRTAFGTILLLAAMLASCNNDDDDPRRETITFEGSSWAPYVASTLGKTYSGDVGSSSYSWTDAATSLTSPMIVSKYGDSEFFSGGFVLSSYNSADESTYGDYATDLYLYNPASADNLRGGGRNGSDNFLVGYGNLDPTQPGSDDYRPELKFSDGVARTIVGCYVNSTCYFYNAVKNGNRFSPALDDDDEVVITATGYDADGRTTGTAKTVIARKGGFVTSWQAWSLSALGKVVSVKFGLSGGPASEYGMTVPTYYALDDITVEW